MAEIGVKWRVLRSISLISWNILLASVLVAAERSLKQQSSTYTPAQEASGSDYFSQFVNFLWQSNQSGYQHVWPEMEFNWPIVLGTIIGFFGAAFGSVGGVGGGGIFVPMLSLVIGFDQKSATAISKCFRDSTEVHCDISMIMGAAISSVYYNLKLRHPTLDMPVIDYDLALLVQPMLMLGISIGVAFNAFFKGVDTWKKETIMKKKEAAKLLEANGNGHEGAEYKLLPDGPSNGTKKESNGTTEREVSIIENVYWKELGLLFFVWVAFLILQITKNYTATCSTAYWVLNLLQIPVSVAITLYEAIGLYKGKRQISSRGDTGTNLKAHQLILYCSCGVLAGIVGGLLGLGGGFILGPLFLELGVPPQVSSATATFAMTFSSSMSVIEYYLLKRFPVPYALYFVAVATVAAFIGQHVVRKLIIILGRASLIIFILAITIFVSAISLGGVGVSNMIAKIEQHEYMGFEDLCKYDA
ncbi:unnamed protein product [Camellia sinensis]